MELSEKGRFAAPPRLAGAGQAVADAVARWDGVHARAHWLLGDESTVDGVDFYVGQKELGHIHLDSEAHVFHSRPVRDALVASGLSKPFRWSEGVGVFRIASPGDVEHALWLFRLAYDRLQGASSRALVGLVRSAVDTNGRS